MLSVVPHPGLAHSGGEQNPGYATELCLGIGIISLGYLVLFQLYFLYTLYYKINHDQPHNCLNTLLWNNIKYLV